MPKKIAVIIGSLRKESFNRKIANELIRLSSKKLDMEIIEIGDLPHYNEDLDENPPKSWVEFRTKIKTKDAILFVSPEYNRTIPGVLKNAIDVGSRPPGKSVWEGKVAAVATASPSNLGGFGSNQNIRQAFVFLNVPFMQQPEMYLSKVNESFLKDGKTVNAKTAAYLQKFLDGFGKWVYQF